MRTAGQQELPPAPSLALSSPAPSSSVALTVAESFHQIGDKQASVVSTLDRKFLGTDQLDFLSRNDTFVCTGGGAPGFPRLTHGSGREARRVESPPVQNVPAEKAATEHPLALLGSLKGWGVNLVLLAGTLSCLIAWPLDTIRRRCRQINQKDRASVGLADEMEAAALLFDATLGDAHSQTMSRFPSGVGGSKERFKDAGLVLDGYPDALVADFDAVPFPPPWSD